MRILKLKKSIKNKEDQDLVLYLISIVTDIYYEINVFMWLLYLFVFWFFEFLCAMIKMRRINPQEMKVSTCYLRLFFSRSSRFSMAFLKLKFKSKLNHT